jgi:hypothetical protein
MLGMDALFQTKSQANRSKESSKIYSQKEILKADFS